MTYFRMATLFLGFIACSCATSPLYKVDPSSGYGTVPRDEMGEPIWSKVTPRKAEKS